MAIDATTLHTEAHSTNAAHAFIVLHLMEDAKAGEVPRLLSAAAERQQLRSDEYAFTQFAGLFVVIVKLGEHGSESEVTETHNRLDKISAEFLNIRTDNPGPQIEFERHH